mmetsp:Transcript_126499/g.282809  ORF Transcript_126499/g.282809 Transcript_126499/m.282809 type:complete len:246 (-) Transcript_126499:422-1159(-)
MADDPELHGLAHLQGGSKAGSLSLLRLLCGAPCAVRSSRRCGAELRRYLRDGYEGVLALDHTHIDARRLHRGNSAREPAARVIAFRQGRDAILDGSATRLQLSHLANSLQHRPHRHEAVTDLAHTQAPPRRRPRTITDGRGRRLRVGHHLLHRQPGLGTGIQEAHVAAHGAEAQGPGHQEALVLVVILCVLKSALLSILSGCSPLQATRRPRSGRLLGRGFSRRRRPAGEVDGAAELTHLPLLRH